MHKTLIVAVTVRLRTVTIWKRPTEEIKDLTTREEFFNEYWWAE